MELTKMTSDFCPVCNNKLRLHSVSRFVECIEKLMKKMGSHEAT